MNSPRIHQLERDPQLAILALLDVALETATNALIAAHLDLCNQTLVLQPASPTTALAEAILHQAHQLRCNLACYRDAVDDVHHTADDDLSDDNLF